MAGPDYLSLEVHDRIEQSHTALLQCLGIFIGKKLLNLPELIIREGLKGRFSHVRIQYRTP